jgi:hypothetical protein
VVFGFGTLTELTGRKRAPEVLARDAASRSGSQLPENPIVMMPHPS